MKITLSKNDLNKVDLSGIAPYTKWAPSAQYLEKPAGDEFYRLVAFLAQKMPSGSTFVDIGTYYGLSACALASAGESTVLSYDIYDHVTDNPDAKTVKSLPNVKIHVKDCLDDISVISKARIVIIDVDPHNGIQENEILDALRANGFQGIVILDDIILNDKMKAFWNGIPERKLDVSAYGHWSGTGIVFFNDSITVELV